MFTRFCKYKKFNELLPIKFVANEVKISVILTALIYIVFSNLGIYENINIYNEAFKNISINIATALIGVLGIILAGISIITSTLNRKNINLIEQTNGENTVERILTSFEFLAFLIGIQIVLFFIIYMCLFSSYSVPKELVFYIITLLIIYLFIFSIFYTVSLVGNSIQFFLAIQNYNEINLLEKNPATILNEVKIDFLFDVLCENSKISKQDLAESLYKYCKGCDYEKKEEVIEYFKKMYDIR